MRLFFLLTGCFLWLTVAAFAQKKVSLSGYIKDAASGETLVGASLYVQEMQTGTASNGYGFYSISMAPGTYTFVVSYMGYTTKREMVELAANRTFDFELQLEGIQAAEVVVTDQRKDENVTTTQMGVTTLTTDQIKRLPVIFGESDILKAVQLLPGVQSAGEGNSGMYVRGGGPDQNLVLLDDAVVYNTGHLFGFFSIFNSDAIKNVTLIKGGMPASYGGRLSSVLDVSMKEGNLKEYHGEGGLGLIASRLTLEGPIVKDKGSFMISGRRTYIDVVSKPFLNENVKGTGYYFYDANLKANYRLGKRDRIYLSGYFGRDVFTFNSKDSEFSLHVPWGNATGTLRWNHQFTDKLFLNTTAVYNDYNFAFSGGQQNIDIKLSSGIRDWNLKSDLDYYSAFGHHFKAGVVYTFHTFSPSQISGRSGETEFNPDNTSKKYAHEAAVYIQDEFDPLPWLKIHAGLRYSLFAQVGPYTGYAYGNDGWKTDSTYYASGSLVKAYAGWEPRLNARFTLDPSTSLKASVSRTNQYIHLVANNGSTLPTDIWVPSTLLVEPQRSWQYALGVYKNFLDNMLETSVEVYYKDMRNQIEYRSGYTPTSFRDPELDFVFGRGYAYGAEFYLNKTRGKFTGWVGYTLSWSWRLFDDLNKGQRFPAKYDRRHDLSIVGSYEFNPKWLVSGVFVYGTGNAITLPTGFYFIEQNLIQDNSAINQYRIFPYHRLDLSVIYTPKGNSEKRWKGSWAFSVYNVYNRFNPYILFVDAQGTLQQGTSVSVKQVSIFPILPSITYNFKF